MRKLLAVVLLGALTACGQGLDGAYRDEMGVSRYVFESGGKVRVEIMGLTQESTYERDGAAVRVKLPQGEATLDLVINQDGSLSGPMGIRLDKVVD